MKGSASNQDKKAIEYKKYKEALLSPMVDTSDVILFAIQTLEGQVHPGRMIRIRNAYTDGNMPRAKELILGALKTIAAHPFAGDEELKQNITDAFERAVDVPEHIHGRRYFETKFAQDMWASLTPEHFDAINSLLQTVKILNDLEPNEDKKLKTPLPDVVENIDQAYVVIGVIRELGDVNQSMLDIIIPTRTNSPNAPKKDRGAQKEGVKDTPIYSMNPGVIRAHAPLSEEERVDVSANKPVDTFRIDRTKDEGFSATREHIPFVNSISGTAYSMVAALRLYVDQHPDMPRYELSRRLDSIVHAFIGFTCMNGYHSIGEMVEVLNEDVVKDLFASANVRLSGRFYSDNLGEVLKSAAFYSDLLNKRQEVNKAARKAHKAKLSDGWKLDPIDPVSYLKKTKEPNAIILIDTPHTILQNSFYSQEYVGEICELTGNYNLMSNVIISPDRLALFHTTAFIETEIQRDPEAAEEEKREEDDLHAMTLDVFYPEVEKYLNSDAGKEEIEACEQEIYGFLRTLINNYTNGGYTESIRAQITDELTIECLKLYDESIARAEHVGKYQKGAMYSDVIPKALHTKIYNKMMNEKIGQIVDRIGDQVITKKGYPRMTLNAGEDRHTFMIAGAPACGKGSAVGKAAVQAKENGIEWRNVCKINTDDHRSIVSDGLPLGEDARNHAQLNNLEAMMISGIAADRYNKKMQDGEAPHLLLDTVNPAMRKFDLGLENKGQMHLFVVSTTVEESISRMVSRGKTSGRYVGSEYLIGAHKLVSKELIDNLAKLTKSGKEVDFVVLDTSVPRGEEPFVVMYGKTGPGAELIIVNEDLADYFYGKKNINQQQRNFEALYTEKHYIKPEERSSIREKIYTEKAEDGEKYYILRPISKTDDSYLQKLESAGFKCTYQRDLNLTLALNPSMAANVLPPVSSGTPARNQTIDPSSPSRAPLVFTPQSASTSGATVDTSSTQVLSQQNTSIQQADDKSSKSKKRKQF